MLNVSCKRAAELVHKNLNEGLTTTEKWRLRIHTSMCAVCKTFEKQTEQIEQAIQSRIQEATQTDLKEFKIETISKIKN